MDDGGEVRFRLEGSSLQGDLAVEAVIIGSSSLFNRVLKVADAVAANDCVVLLEGESGTGKELLARRIHCRSKRAAGPFIPVNCPAISDTLFESQFYGHLRGSFTGASADTLGIVRAAEGGTLMLDEIGELPLHLQPKLLRLLQQREVTPVGAARPVPVNVRFVAATNSNLVKQVAEGNFRRDLFHRLNIVRIEVPPLRQRVEDIRDLLDFYLDYYAQQYDMPRYNLSSYLRDCLLKYPWPGNVRELCGYVERLYATNLPPMAPEDELEEDLLPGQGVPQLTPAMAVAASMAESHVHDAHQTEASLSLAQAEATMIRRALEQTRYNRSAAAKLLRIHRTTLLRKIRLLGLDA
ncbi:MAG: sigma 54-interacting transcriptional regulator [Phycisphaerae bacterium]